uniref:Uncharacterized protein n=1 Tax=Arundo donax TaxID=35708 RepID=A0A0A8ZWV2_ARUDO
MADFRKVVRSSKPPTAVKELFARADRYATSANALVDHQDDRPQKKDKKDHAESSKKGQKRKSKDMASSERG